MCCMCLTSDAAAIAKCTRFSTADNGSAANRRYKFRCAAVCVWVCMCVYSEVYSICWLAAFGHNHESTMRVTVQWSSIKCEFAAGDATVAATAGAVAVVAAMHKKYAEAVVFVVAAYLTLLLLFLL